MKKQGPICVGVDVCVFVLVFGSLELRMALDENLTHLLLLCHTACRFFSCRRPQSPRWSPKCGRSLHRQNEKNTMRWLVKTGLGTTERRSATLGLGR